MSFIDNLKKRRTIYHLSNQLDVDNQELVEYIKEAVRHSPSAFNSQSSRVVILLGDEHKKLWQFFLDALKEVSKSEEAFAGTKQRLENGMISAYGTVLFFEDTEVVKALQAQYPTYADNFPKWSEHSSAIAQLSVWTALADRGIGANLQHYHPLAQQKIYDEWQIPSTWNFIAQMPFGKIVEPAGPKDFMDDDKRFKVFGA
ncbi:nitroreductase family protein [Brackiella oedipodis]|uniref:nitroreductase family protein n=1 Tax=Brackiella oedipodis TaxID=124225 RepID=UPI00048E4D59|nr:nitroreductase family protein [Brackiella oedipodis]